MLHVQGVGARRHPIKGQSSLPGSSPALLAVPLAALRLPAPADHRPGPPAVRRGRRTHPGRPEVPADGSPRARHAARQLVAPARDRNGSRRGPTPRSRSAAESHRDGSVHWRRSVRPPRPLRRPLPRPASGPAPGRPPVAPGDRGRARTAVAVSVSEGHVWAPNGWLEHGRRPARRQGSQPLMKLGRPPSSLAPRTGLRHYKDSPVRRSINERRSRASKDMNVPHLRSGNLGQDVHGLTAHAHAVQEEDRIVAGVDALNSAEPDGSIAPAEVARVSAEMVRVSLPVPGSVTVAEAMS